MKLGEGDYQRQTLTVPLIPHPDAMISPQYLSLHQDMHHPPSASLFPNPGLVLCCCCCSPCCKACATSEAEAPSREEWLCVGVARAIVFARERNAGDEMNCKDWTSISSQRCQLSKEGCSMHS